MSKTKGDGLRRLRNISVLLGIAMCLPMAVYVYADIRYDLRDFSENDRLYLAAENKNLSAAEEFIEKGADPCGENRYGKTAIARSAELDDVHMMSLFLEKGADPNSPAGANKTILGAAAENHSLEMTELLLSAGAVPDYDTDRYVPALHLAAANDKEYSADIVELLVNAGADPASKAVQNGKVMLPYRYYYDLHKEDEDITEEEEARFQRIKDILYEPYMQWLKEKMTAENERLS
ncbi:MAG: ankyrin repeat domain-containing protein [Huintestinicola sp.]|uniref:ankyrin repeat domain-containing protein n=1 Tax=Huintestinicola sp. TaxID=2981661 RepID=UPI003F0116E5